MYGKFPSWKFPWKQEQQHEHSWGETQYIWEGLYRERCIAKHDGKECGLVRYGFTRPAGHGDYTTTAARAARFVKDHLQKQAERVEAVREQRFELVDTIMNLRVIMDETDKADRDINRLRDIQARLLEDITQGTIMDPEEQAR